MSLLCAGPLDDDEATVRVHWTMTKRRTEDLLP